MAQTQQEGCLIRFINNVTDEPESDLDMLFFQLQEYRKSLIGSSFYFIRADQPSPALCRLIYGGGRLYSTEILDHEQHGISDEDIEEAIKHDRESMNIPGHHHISPHIEKKLRVLFELK